MVFSDNTYMEINLSKTINKIRIFSFQNLLDSNLIKPNLKHPLKVMIWFYFSYKGVRQFTTSKDSMISQKYIEALESNLPLSINSMELEKYIFY